MTGVGRLGRALLSSYFGLLVVFLYAPLVVLLVFAFNAGTIPTLPIKSFSTHWFSRAFQDTELTSALLRSLLIALVNGLAATLLGVAAAVSLARERLPLRGVVVTMILLPLVVPYIVLAVGLVVLLHEFGIATSLAAVLAGHVVISLPYSVLVILPRLRTLDPSVAEAARDLGASDFKAFLYVTLPLLAPALLSSFLIAFTISFDEFAIASFLAPPGSPTYPVFLYAGARTPALLPEVIAVGSIVIVVSIAVVIAADVFRRWAERRIEALPEATPLVG
ncbi:MAG TPA: ABC transporter permease [Solirubrobacteraceae bacterium]|nr:ABC transporter permease [Solirubrobacteraceae bacterium]